MRAPSKRAFAFSNALDEDRLAQAAAMLDPKQQSPGDWAHPAKWSEFDKVTCGSYVAPYSFPPHLSFIRRRERWVYATVALEHNANIAAHGHVFFVTASSITRKPWPPTDALGSRVSFEQEAKQEKELEDMPADIANVPALDLRAGGDEKKRYFLIKCPRHCSRGAGWQNGANATLTSINRIIASPIVLRGLELVIA